MKIAKIRYATTKNVMTQVGVILMGNPFSLMLKWMEIILKMMMKIMNTFIKVMIAKIIKIPIAIK